MATTIIPNIDEPRDSSVDMDSVYAHVKEWLISSQGDCDKSTDPEDESFYAGQVSIAHGVLNLMQGKNVNYPDTDANAD